MTFEIKRLDLRDSATLRQVVELHVAAFGSDYKDLERQARHNSIEAPEGSLFLGAYDGERLVGVNGFIRHRVVFRGKYDYAYQSCSTATDPDYRGRGIFSDLINHALKELASHGLLICGFPNVNSSPIFTGPLGFRSVPLVKVLIPGMLARPIFSRLGRICSGAGSDSNLIAFDQDEIIGWKQQAGGEPLQIGTLAGVTLWGRERQRSVFGLRNRSLAIGGFGPSIREAGPCRNYLFYSVSVADSDALRRAARFAWFFDNQGEFIYYILQPNVGEVQFLAFGGFADYA